MSTSCVLSPYGSYLSQGNCEDATTCANTWRCARHLDENGNPEVDPETGVPVLPGSPIFVSDGQFASADQCMCYVCNVDEATNTATCSPTDGVQGEHADSACGDTCNYGWACDQGVLNWRQGGTHGPELTQCSYVCDGSGGRRLVEPGENLDGVAWEDANCFDCLAENSGPVPTQADQLGQVPTAASACTYSCTAGDKLYDPAGIATENLLCYQCESGDTPVPVDGLSGQVGADAVCAYECDVEGQKVWLDGGVAHADLNCFDCTGDHAYTPVPGTAGGEFGEDGGACYYWCDADGGGAVTNLSAAQRAEAQDAGTLGTVARETNTEVTCYSCDGGPGPDSACSAVSQTVGDYATSAACDADPSAQCGWGFGCEGDACAVNDTAPRGRTQQECQMDSVEQCGWGYGCFSSFACVDGASCVGVPDSQCAQGDITCYSSEAECVEQSACLHAVCDNPFPHEYTLVRAANNNVPLNAGGKFRLELYSNVDGVAWYASNTTDANNTPFLEVGVRDFVNEAGTREVQVAFRGMISFAYGSDPSTPPASYDAMWSGDSASYSYPEFRTVATDISADDCLIFDSIFMSGAKGGEQGVFTKLSSSGQDVAYSYLKPEPVCPVDSVDQFLTSGFWTTEGGGNLYLPTVGIKRLALNTVSIEGDLAVRRYNAQSGDWYVRHETPLGSSQATLRVYVVLGDRQLSVARTGLDVCNFGDFFLSNPGTPELPRLVMNQQACNSDAGCSTFDTGGPDSAGLILTRAYAGDSPPASPAGCGSPPWGTGDRWRVYENGVAQTEGERAFQLLSAGTQPDGFTRYNASGGTSGSTVSTWVRDYKVVERVGSGYGPVRYVDLKFSGQLMNGMGNYYSLNAAGVGTVGTPGLVEIARWEPGSAGYDDCFDIDAIDLAAVPSTLSSGSTTMVLQREGVCNAGHTDGPGSADGEFVGHIPGTSGSSPTAGYGCECPPNSNSDCVCASPFMQGTRWSVRNSFGTGDILDDTTLTRTATVEPNAWGFKTERWKMDARLGWIIHEQILWNKHRFWVFTKLPGGRTISGSTIITTDGQECTVEDFMNTDDGSRTKMVVDRNYCDSEDGCNWESVCTSTGANGDMQCTSNPVSDAGFIVDDDESHRMFLENVACVAPAPCLWP